MAAAHLSTSRAITIRCCLHRHSPGSPAQGNWFCHAVNPTPRKRFPCQPAQCQDSFYFPDCQSQILSDFRLQKIDYLGSIMTDALLKMPTYSKRKGKISPPAPFLYQTHLPSTAGFIFVSPGNNNSTKGSAHALIRMKHSLMERFHFFIFPEKGYPRKTIYDYSPTH